MDYNNAENKDTNSNNSTNDSDSENFDWLNLIITDFDVDNPPTLDNDVENDQLDIISNHRDDSTANNENNQHENYGQTDNIENNQLDIAYKHQENYDQSVKIEHNHPDIVSNHHQIAEIENNQPDITSNYDQTDNIQNNKPDIAYIYQENYDQSVKIEHNHHDIVSNHHQIAEIENNQHDIASNHRVNYQLFQPRMTLNHHNNYQPFQPRMTSNHLGNYQPFQQMMTSNHLGNYQRFQQMMTSNLPAIQNYPANMNNFQPPISHQHHNVIINNNQLPMQPAVRCNPFDNNLNNLRPNINQLAGNDNFININQHVVLSNQHVINSNNDQPAIEHAINNNQHNKDNKPTAFDFDSMPPGFRFEPKDRELILYYLRPKTYGQPLPPNRIREVDLYTNNPEHFAATYPMNGDGEWYFFTSRNRKYPNGGRPQRSAGEGYWKASGKDKKIKFEGRKIGYRKSLVFYKGKPPKGDKTDWIMKEFTLHDPPQRERNGQSDMKLDDSVISVIYKKNERRKIASRHRDDSDKESDTEFEEGDTSDANENPNEFEEGNNSNPNKKPRL